MACTVHTNSCGDPLPLNFAIQLGFCRDQEMLQTLHYDEDIAIAKALISHLQANVSAASSYLGGEGESPSSSTTNLDASDGTAASGGVVSTRDSAVDQKPGEFVRKKDTEEEVLVPAKWTMVRRRSKREKRKSTVSQSLFLSLSLVYTHSLTLENVLIL